MCIASHHGEGLIDCLDGEGNPKWIERFNKTDELTHLVEVETKTGRLKPVEYKRGKPKPNPMDEIQLCAQGLCLEEMTGQTVSEGALWYMQTRYRIPVVFSGDLRAQTLATIAAVRELLNSGQTPPPDYGKRCKACSLVEICQPELLGKRDRSVGYVEGLFNQ